MRTDIQGLLHAISQCAYELDNTHVIDQSLILAIRNWAPHVDDPAAFVDRVAAVIKQSGYQKLKTDGVVDAFSQGQLDSKTWLIRTAESLGLELKHTWTLCGWIGTLGYLMLAKKNQLSVTSVRSFDIDDRCADLAETLNRSAVKDGWIFKSFTHDVNLLDYDAFNWRVWSTVNNRMSHPITDRADTIINTSCDHMGDDRTWWDRIPSGRLVILQNNDWYENDQHNNSVVDLTEFKAQYPMNQLLFEGELDCTLYTRFMLIGRK
jgi:hypothetical protein